MIRIIPLQVRFHPSNSLLHPIPCTQKKKFAIQIGPVGKKLMSEIKADEIVTLSKRRMKVYLTLSKSNSVSPIWLLLLGQGTGSKQYIANDIMTNIQYCCNNILGMTINKKKTKIASLLQRFLQLFSDIRSKNPPVFSPRKSQSFFLCKESFYALFTEILLVNNLIPFLG